MVFQIVHRERRDTWIGKLKISQSLLLGNIIQDENSLLLNFGLLAVFY